MRAFMLFVLLVGAEALQGVSPWDIDASTTAITEQVGYQYVNDVLLPAIDNMIQMIEPQQIYGQKGGRVLIAMTAGAGVVGWIAAGLGKEDWGVIEV